MGQLPIVTNRTVYADVKLESGVADPIADDAFSRMGWLYEGVDGRYTIGIPLYCAKGVALSSAKSKIRAFSQQWLPLRVDEVRLARTEDDSRKPVSVKTLTHWINRLVPKVASSPDVGFGALDWEIMIDRHKVGGVAERRQGEIDAATKMLSESTLPGKRFSPSEMRLFTAAEPINVVEDPGARPVRGAFFVLFLTLIFVVTAGSAAFAFFDLHWLIRVEAGTAAVVGVYAITKWSTGDRVSGWVRVAHFLVGIIFAAFLGFAISSSFVQLVGSGISVLAPGVLILLLGYFGLWGWRHLVILYPAVRIFWSIQFITVSFASILGLSQFISASWASRLGIASEDLAVPAWVNPLLAIYVYLMVLMVLFGVGAAFGWAAYFDIETLGAPMKTFVYVSAAMVALLALLAAGGAAFGNTAGFVEDWKQELREGRTPWMSEEFIYRACVDFQGESSNPVSAIDEPVVVVEGSDGQFWEWRIESDTVEDPDLVKIDNAEVSRAQDGATTCQ